jgi:hypothetical protein
MFTMRFKERRESMNYTFVKLYRRLLDDPLLTVDNNAYVMFTKLLLKVDYRTGSITLGRKQLAHLCNLKPSTAYATIKRLEASNMIATSSQVKFTKITVVNWQKYQSRGTDTQQVDDISVSAPQENNGTIKRNKNKNKNKNIYSEDDKLLELLNEKTSRSFRTLPNGYKKTLEAFSLEEIGKALDNMKSDEWHAPRLSELKSDYLLRSSTIDNMLSRSAKEEATNSNDWFDSQPVDIY